MRGEKRCVVAREERSCRVGVRVASCHATRPRRCPMVRWASQPRAGGRAGSAARCACARALVCFDGRVSRRAASGEAMERWSGARSVARNKHATVAQHLRVILGMLSVRARLATKRSVGVRGGVGAADGGMSRIGIRGGRCVARRFALLAARTRMAGSGRRGECEGGADDSLRGGDTALRARAASGRSRSRVSDRWQSIPTATWTFFFDLALALELPRGGAV